MEPDRRPAIGVPGHFDLTPADRAGALKGLQRFVHGFLGRDPRGRVAGRIRTGCEVGPFIVGEESLHGMVTFVCQEPGHALEIHQVHPDADHVHGQAHQNDAKPASGAGAGR